MASRAGVSMPQVDVTYSGLILQAVGQRSERRDLPDGATLGDLLRDLERKHGEPVRKLLFDERRGLLSHALVAVNGTAMRDLAAPIGRDGALVRILVMSPMMIGG